MKKITLAILGLSLLSLFLIACGSSRATESESKIETPSETEAPCTHDEMQETARTDALALADGSVTRACKSCGHTETEIIPATGTIKVLAIGNSFSVDAVAHLQGLMKAAGIKQFVIGDMYIGGCSLDLHWKNAQNGKKAYRYTKRTADVTTVVEETSLETALTDEQWDIVTLQQASPYSGLPSTYTNLRNMINFVHNTSLNPDVKIMWHMTWAYQGNYAKDNFANYDYDQMGMYNAIISTVESQVLTKRKIVDVIPAGTAVQNLRTSYLGDTITRDGSHMSSGIGRYTAGLTWLVKLTGASVEDLTWVPTEYPNVKKDLGAIKEAVMNAIQTPLSITQSEKYKSSAPKAPETEAPETEAPSSPELSGIKLPLSLVPGGNDSELFQTLGLDLGEYMLLNWEPTYRAYWNSQSSMKLNIVDSDIALRYIGSRLINKAELPVGSIIIVDQGYRYRPEAWVNSSTKNSSSTRPASTENTITLVNDAWWGEYNYRAFNLARKSGNAATTDADHLRIYVPSGK